MMTTFLLLSMIFALAAMVYISMMDAQRRHREHMQAIAWAVQRFEHRQNMRRPVPQLQQVQPLWADILKPAFAKRNIPVEAR